MGHYETMIDIMRRHETAETLGDTMDAMRLHDTAYDTETIGDIMRHSERL